MTKKKYDETNGVRETDPSRYQNRSDSSVWSVWDDEEREYGIYALKDAKGRIRYVGMSVNVEARFEQHARGRVQSTAELFFNCREQKTSGWQNVPVARKRHHGISWEVLQQAFGRREAMDYEAKHIGLAIQAGEPLLNTSADIGRGRNYLKKAREEYEAPIRRLLG